MKFQPFHPTTTQLQAFLAKQEKSNFSYKEIGQTKNNKVIGYDNDEVEVYLGRGEVVWEAAKKALSNWQHFPVHWAKIHAESMPPYEGQTVVVLFKLFGLWWFNAARLVYTFDESHRFGFAYGTLEQHVEQGEEIFWIYKNEKGEVFYQIKAFSKPNWWAVKLAYPLARSFQRRFQRDSFERMKNIAEQAQKNAGI